MHNRLHDVEIQSASSAAPSRRSSTRSTRTPSRKGSRKDSTRSQRKGSQGQDVEADRLEYVGEWSEVSGSRLTNDTMTSPLFGTPKCDGWQENSLYVPTESSPLSTRMERSAGRPEVAGVYRNMTVEPEPVENYQTASDEDQPGTDYGTHPEQSQSTTAVRRDVSAVVILQPHGNSALCIFYCCRIRGRNTSTVPP